MIIIIVSSLFTRRAALEMWKQKLGSTATYSNLIGVFERAGYQGYADTVYKLGRGVFSSVRLSNNPAISIDMKKKLEEELRRRREVRCYVKQF